MGPVPNDVWRRFRLPASWAPYTGAELDELIEWWRREVAPPVSGTPPPSHV